MQTPAEFVCPITQETMVDPVVASDGNSYERRAIQEVLDMAVQKGKTMIPLSPLTRE